MKITRTTLRFAARKGNLLVQRRAEFDGMTDGLGSVKEDWKVWTLEDYIKELQWASLCVITDEDIYTHTDSFKYKIRGVLA